MKLPEQPVEAAEGLRAAQSQNHIDKIAKNDATIDKPSANKPLQSVEKESKVQKVQTVSNEVVIELEKLVTGDV